MRTLIIASLIAVAAFGTFTTMLYAQDNRAAQVARMGWLSIPEVYTKLESAGYRHIEKIERERGSYEVKATDRNGQRMKLYVHPQTGEVINQRERASKRNSADCNKRRCRDDLLQSGTTRPATEK